jgi:putative PIN family toxin of toxin-antitoxin system
VTRLVLDTNVVVSAMLFRSETARLLELWRERRFRLVASRAILAEYERVLLYPRFKLRPEEAAAIMAEYVRPYCEVWRDAGGPRVCRDPDDDKFLQCAVSAAADGLVTGDSDILSCGPKYRGVPILTPAQALSLVG